MFTGIITDIGEILAVSPQGSGKRIRIGTAYRDDTIDVGASIACAGCCLTVIARGRGEGAGKPFWFDVEVSPETLELTTAANWSAGTPVNLERALRLGDELGGHMVSGHVDGTALVAERTDDGGMAVMWFEIPPALARYVAVKGSVALDGTSLTVNRVEDRRFSVMIIPHTLGATTWGAARPGDQVNLEVDQMARYVERLSAGLGRDGADGR